MGGADALRGQFLALQVIPGVELSLRDMAGLHLLGYGADARAAALRHKLDELSKARVERAAEMCRLLTRLGFPLSLQELPCQGTVGRAHIARAMVERGWVATVQEAFDRFLAEGAPAYVPGQRLSMAEALELLHGCGMVPVLAHPALIPVDALALPVLLKHWRAQGLQGVEVYHPAQSAQGYAVLEQQARRARPAGGGPTPRTAGAGGGRARSAGGPGPPVDADLGGRPCAAGTHWGNKVNAGRFTVYIDR